MRQQHFACIWSRHNMVVTQAKAEEDQKRVVALKADGGKAAAGAPKTPRAPTAYVVRNTLAA